MTTEMPLFYDKYNVEIGCRSGGGNQSHFFREKFSALEKMHYLAPRNEADTKNIHFVRGKYHGEHSIPLSRPVHPP
jgi:hypothetical protein